MMTPESFLPTLAELAITIAGFTALIVTLRHETSTRWDREILLRVIGTIAVCLVTLVCAAIPYALSGFDIDPHWRWGVPLVLSSATVLLLFVVLIRRMVNGGFVFLVPWVTVPVIATMGLLSIISMASGFGIIYPYSPGLLVAQLTWCLFGSAVTLVATLAITVRQQAS